MPRRRAQVRRVLGLVVITVPIIELLSEINKNAEPLDGFPSLRLLLNMQYLMSIAFATVSVPWFENSSLASCENVKKSNARANHTGIENSNEDHNNCTPTQKPGQQCRIIDEKRLPKFHTHQFHTLTCWVLDWSRTPLGISSRLLTRHASQSLAT